MGVAGNALTETIHERRVRALLDRYHETHEQQYLNSDFDATIALADLGVAIDRAGLTDRQRAALQLVFVEDLEQADAGRTLGITQQALSLHINAGIRKIAKIYETWEELDNEI